MVIDREETGILFVSDGKEAFESNVDLGSFYSNFWSLYRSGMIELDLDAAYKFAKYIEDCPDEYIRDIVQDVFLKYDIDKRVLLALIDRSNKLVSIFKRYVQYKIKSAKLIESHDELEKD